MMRVSGYAVWESWAHAYRDTEYRLVRVFATREQAENYCQKRIDDRSRPDDQWFEVTPFQWRDTD